MLLTWTPDLAVGIQEIDKQHQELFKHINDLLEASQKGLGKTQVQDVVKFLEGYVVFHFGTEERYMDQYKYPGVGDHKKEHIWFVDQWQGLKQQLDAEGPTVLGVLSTKRLLVDWLLNHVQKTDRALGAFLKKHGA